MCMYIKSTEPAQRTLLMPGVELKRCDCAKCRRHGWEDRIGGGGRSEEEKEGRMLFLSGQLSMKEETKGRHSSAIDQEESTL